MASSLLRSRVLSILSRNLKTNRNFCSSKMDKESIISSQSIISEAAAEPSVEAVSAVKPPPEAEASGSKRKFWSYLNYGIAATLTGAFGYAGYATYAYSLDEVEEKTKALRQSANYRAGDDALATDYQRFLYSAVMTVPAKVVELYLDLRRSIEEQVKGFTEPTSEKLLPDLHPAEQHVFTLVLDLNETIVYSDWKRERGWRTFKRPGVDDFLQHLARLYEVVVYSDQLNMYVDPVIERLDTNHCIRYRLSRGATKYQDGKHYRDLSKLNRDPGKIIYISAHAFENSLQPDNCIPIKPFNLDEKREESVDTTLLDLIPFLEYVARASPVDIRKVLASYKREDIAKEFKERSKETQRRMQEQRHPGFFIRR